jgi:hypothetical protein
MSEKSYIVEHTYSDGKLMRWCARCMLHVDKNNEVDQDYYTARQYFKFMAVPVEDRCKHSAYFSDTKEELKKRVLKAGCTPELESLLTEIIRRLPGV